MLNKLSKLVFLLFSTFAFAQTGHLMQGVGAVNMSMGGAATAQPLDISGAMQWNPAALSVFDGSILKLDVGLFKGTPTLYSSLPAGAMWPADAFGPGSPASPSVTGSTESELGYNVMPALGFAWGKYDSKHTFGISAFGVSGFGVDFPQETNLPMNSDGSPNPNWNPNDSSPILYPQSLNGFGHLESAYMLMQIGFTWAYEISDKLSIGVQPTFNYEALDLSPNPLASPTATGYPTDESASAIGFGGQLGLFYDSQKGIKLGASYKTSQKFSEMDFGNGTKFQMDYPAIYSIGLGYSKGIIDFALDYRYVDYAGTEGFEKTGWTPTASIQGFGWESMSIVSTGLQLKAIKKVPLRFGYTYSTNPIQEELTFFSTPATAIIAHAFQFGFSYELSDTFIFDAVYHYGISDGKTSGNLFNPMAITPSNSLGKIPGSEVAYDMNTHMFMIGVQFKLGGKDTDDDGVKDKDDVCPNIAGLEQFNGCPDTDGDGIKDSEDSCPDVAGLAALNGCPDSDGDGFSDKEDLCPKVAGLEQFNGCPDTDGDGVMDSKDACPNEAGLIENKGCPLMDADADGVADKDDKCPNIAGVAFNYGCPEVTKAVQKEITDLARAIYFKTGKNSFTDETSIRLDGVSKILSEYTASKFIVEGHTDSTGSDKVNTALSQKRADAVMNFLIENGFPAENIKAIGYGSSSPIGDNKTKQGRQENRRVEIFLD
ncbi:MAG: OmpA family protein [Flavobacteriaceae bacterium]|nr:OmpA family protein [Flavobacteriaceae bacterium]